MVSFMNIMMAYNWHTLLKQIQLYYGFFESQVFNTITHLQLGS